MAFDNQQFDNFDQWVAQASLWLTRSGSTERAICFDMKGRICNSGHGFMRARDESAFPVRWLWPSQVPQIVTAAEAMATAVVYGETFDPAVDDFLNTVPGLVDRVRIAGEAA